MLKYLLLPLVGLLPLFAGCRTVQYKEIIYPDGIIEKHVHYGVVGFDTKVGGLSIEATRDTKKLTLSDWDTNSKNAVDVIGKLVDKVPSYGGTVVTPSAPIIVNPANPPSATPHLPPRRPDTNPVQ